MLKEKGQNVWYPETTQTHPTVLGFAQLPLVPAQSFEVRPAPRGRPSFPLPSEARLAQKPKSAWPSNESQTGNMTKGNDSIFESPLHFLLGTETF